MVESVVDAGKSADDVVGLGCDDEVLDHVGMRLGLFGGGVGCEDFDAEVGGGFGDAICDARNSASLRLPLFFETLSMEEKGYRTCHISDEGVGDELSEISDPENVNCVSGHWPM